jgi:hypothetical protein
MKMNRIVGDVFNKRHEGVRFYRPNGPFNRFDYFLKEGYNNITDLKHKDVDRTGEITFYTGLHLFAKLVHYWYIWEIESIPNDAIIEVLENGFRTNKICLKRSCKIEESSYWNQYDKN